MDTKNYTGIHIKNFDLKTENGIFGDLKLFLLLFFHAIGGILWIALNRVPPTWDAALHTMLSFKLLQYIQVHLFQFDIVSFLKISEYYPPFVHFTGIIIALFSGESYKAMQILGLVYFLLSVSVLYFYSFKIFKNKTIAFLSAFFFIFFITNYQQSRDFMFLQERSKHFSRTKETIFYSIFIGIAVLTKWTSLFFLILPFLLTLEEGRRIHKDQQFLVLKNILVGVPIVGGICLPWYLVNLQRFIDISKVTSIGELADPQNLLSLQNIFFNINLLSMYQLTYIGAAFFLICLIFFLNSAHKKQIILIGGTIILNYLIFTFISNKNIRYTMPLTPFIAMIMAYGSHKLLTSTSHIAKVASFFIAMWYVISYFILSFGVPIQPNYRIGIKDIDFVYLDSYPVKVLYDNTNWHNTEILNTIYSSSSPAEQGRDITVLSTPIFLSCSRSSAKS
ncbi:MAG: hypothetical protein NTZ55_01550 [Candidatus Roizmanbacteria bacterium]|nr:hypothetical protein [Candidatus Roizmanbacteria bacterium]